MAAAPERDEQHDVRAARAIRAAVARVPFYAKQALAVPEEGAPLAAVLAAVPLLTPARIRPTLPKMWLPEGRDAKAELASGQISVIESGLSESRVRLIWDGAWWRHQEQRALALDPSAAEAMRAGAAYRDAVLWVAERGTGSCGSGDPSYEDRLDAGGARLHLNSRQDPTFWSEAVMTRMLDELAQHRTQGLLADPYYLDALARHATQLGRTLAVSGFIALTRALATGAQRAAIDAARPRDPGGEASASLLRVYGAREAGILFVEGDDGKMHHAPLTTHVELVPARVATPGASDVALVVVTTLDREVQPLVRYVLGDLVQVAGGPSRFSTVPPLASVEGKLDDAVIRPDGAIVTPGALDRALEATGARAYQVSQEEAGAVLVEVVGAAPSLAEAALAPLLEGMRVTARAATAIAIDPNGKYRSSRRSPSIAAPGHAFGDAEDTKGSGA